MPQAASAVRECGVTLNYNSLPFDPNGPMITSGLRIGTPAVTTLGMGADEMVEIAGIIKSVLGFRQFSMRGLDKVRGEWSLVTMAWNLKRMFVLAG